MYYVNILNHVYKQLIWLAFIGKLYGLVIFLAEQIMGNKIIKAHTSHLLCASLCPMNFFLQ